jgi:hypothetical protein
MLMVGRTEAAASAATLALQKALPASCRSCFLAFKVRLAAALLRTAIMLSNNGLSDCNLQPPGCSMYVHYVHIYCMFFPGEPGAQE